MQLWLIIWAAVFIIAGVAAFGLRKLRRQAEAARIPQRPPAIQLAAPAAADPTPTAPANALALGQKVASLYENSAHPSDLLGQAEFEDGVRALSNSAVPLEQLTNYCVGSNEELAVVAAEALARRSDGDAGVARAAAYLIHANVWRAFFIVRLLEKHA